MEQLEFVFRIRTVLRKGFEPMGHFSHYLGSGLIVSRKMVSHHYCTCPSPTVKIDMSPC